MGGGERVHAWRPAVPGVGEVLHARFTQHAYPAHTHDLWTVLLVDTGGVSYDLDRRPQEAPAGSLTLLPPHVPTPALPPATSPDATATDPATVSQETC
jgi:hypothetical protein